MKSERRRWDGDDAAALAAELRASAGDPAGIAADVAAVIDQVRSGGDEALLELSERYDGARPENLWIERSELETAAGALDRELRQALEIAATNIRTVAEKQAEEPGPGTVALPQGQQVTIRRVPVDRAVVYAPGGRAAYPSSVLMGVIPARVAGVRRVAVASPPQEGGRPHEVVLAAAAIAGADSVLAVGGAQAVAACAYGTESVLAADMIAGPGGPWVQEAKLQVSRRVGIDGYAGPSELLLVCDANANAEWLALDLCAQAEHGPDSPLVVASTDAATLGAIGAAAERFAADRPSVADARLALIEVPSLDAALELSQAYAPEHLEIDCEGADQLASRVTTAGCVFVGSHGATAFGDYAAGSNHTLPTGGAGRFAGPLSPFTFMRRISEVRVDGVSAAALAPTVDAIARSEGFPVHGESTLARADDDDAPAPTDRAS